MTLRVLVTGGRDYKDKLPPCEGVEAVKPTDEELRSVYDENAFGDAEHVTGLRAVYDAGVAAQRELPHCPTCICGKKAPGKTVR